LLRGGNRELRGKFAASGASRQPGRAFQGTCFALIKGKKAGQIVLTAGAPGLVGAKINIAVK